jgi:hypothetical protein
MDAKSFDQIAIDAASGTRRGLMLRLSAAALGGGLLAALDQATEARRRRKHRHKKKRKHQPPTNSGCFCGVNQTCVGGVCTFCDVCVNECPFATVQAAVNAASPGSTIRVCGGFFRQPVTINKNLTLTGAGSQTGGTVLKGNGTARMVSIGPEVTVSLVDMAIDDGFSSDDGGGCFNEGTLKLTNCVVRNSRAQRGGGIFNAGTRGLALFNTTVTGNSASDTGGGIFNDVSGDVTLTGGSVTGNTPNNCAGDPVDGCSEV